MLIDSVRFGSTFFFFPRWFPALGVAQSAVWYWKVQAFKSRRVLRRSFCHQFWDAYLKLKRTYPLKHWPLEKEIPIGKLNLKVAGLLGGLLTDIPSYIPKNHPIEKGKSYNNIIFQTSIFGFHVKFPGCISHKFWGFHSSNSTIQSDWIHFAGCLLCSGCLQYSGFSCCVRRFFGGITFVFCTKSMRYRSSGCSEPVLLESQLVSD